MLTRWAAETENYHSIQLVRDALMSRLLGFVVTIPVLFGSVVMIALPVAVLCSTSSIGAGMRFMTFFSAAVLSSTSSKGIPGPQKYAQ